MEADMSNREQERLRRLREQQLQSRDPHVKQRKIQRNITVKEKRMRKSFSPTEAWGDLSHVIKVPFYALLIGTAVIILLPMFWASPFAAIAGTGFTAILIIFGLVLGNALDIRDEIRKNIK
jgi:Flp pilus assembly protein TadB